MMSDGTRTSVAFSGFLIVVNACNLAQIENVVGVYDVLVAG